ncbi:MAG: AMP-binding protein [Caldilineaceae bacterium]
MNLEQLIDKLAQQGVFLSVQAQRLVIQRTQGALDAATEEWLTDFEEEIVLWLESQTTVAQQQTLPQVIGAPADRYAPFPLTDIQHAYWVGRSGSFALGDVGTHVYFEVACQPLDLNRLNAAWQQVITRHEMLRAVVTPDGQQRIVSELPDWQITVDDLRGQSPLAVEAHLAAVRDELSHQVLPAERWPLFDLRASQLVGETRLHLSLDVLFWDFASLLMILNEWQTLYEDPLHKLPLPQLTFRDYVLAAQQIETTALYQQAESYWRSRLASLPPAPELPLAQEPAQIAQTRTHRRAALLDRSTWAQLQQRGQQQGLTANGVLLAAFAEVLTVWSKQPAFTLNLTLFNRLPLHPAVNSVIGDFTTINLLAVDNSQPAPFVTRAQQLQKQLWDDLDQRAFSGVRVLRELARQRDATAGGVQMPIIFTSGLGFDAGRGFHPFGELVYGISQTPQAWLDHIVIEEAGELVFHWDAVEALFPAGLLDDLFAAYCDLLHRLANAPATWQMAHPVPLPRAQQVQRTAVNDTAAAISDEMLHTLFLQQLPLRANQPAVLTAQRSLSYDELYQRANQVGHWLRSQGARPNRLVAVVMEKGWEQVVAVLGIHLAGAAYLPIDPSLPNERRHYLLQQGEVVLALTQSKLRSQLSWPADIHVLTVDTLTPTPALAPLAIVQQPTDLAYVIYTSGSTGQPKGVMIDHRGAVNTVLDINRRFGVTAQDRVLCLSALNFDLSVYDLFGLLAVGGAIVLPDPDLRTDPAHWLDLMHQHGVTLWDTVPALMQMLVDTVESGQGPALSLPKGDKVTRWQGDRVTSTSAVTLSPHYPVTQSPLRLVMLSGDWIPVTLPDRIKACWPGVTVYGLGGATEASIWSNYFLIEEVDRIWPSIPYGKPLTNQSFQVLDANLNPRPVWLPGDLYIGGIGLALGYWKDEEKTQAKFIIHPQTGQRLYKTGDLARYLPDGNLEFLGREDFQVKIRGHRIELGEIENTLLQYPGIKEAVVNAVGDPKGHRQLAGYVVLDTHAQESLNAVPMALKQIPDVYEQRLNGTITDPINRLEFKLRQPGIRHQLEYPPIALPSRPFDEHRRHDWLARQSYRRFLEEVIPLEVFSDFLSCLQQMRLEDAPLPKYRYPSAGNLYPVQTYLYVKPGRIDGLAGGCYYYHPAYHQLVPLQSEQNQSMGDFQVGAANQTIFTQAAFTLFLVADLAAIAPIYGEIARDFALLETGYVSQLLMMQAPSYELGLCPLGVADQTSLQSAFALGTEHQLLHCLAGGRIDPCQMKTWLQPTAIESAGAEKSSSDSMSWSQRLQKHLGQKLPDYMIPTVYLFLNALPLTPNGKVDRKALPLPDLTTGENRNFTPPHTATEQLLAALWSTLLDVRQVGIYDNFFALGGDSLILTQLRTRLREHLQIDLPLGTFFEKNTIADFAMYIDAYKAAQTMAVHPNGTQDQLNIDDEEETW